MIDELKDIKCTQDVKIVQQIISTFMKNNTGSALNVVNIGQINTVTEKDKNRELSSEEVMAFFEQIPPPRLENFTNMMIQLALEKFHKQKDAAMWLGITERAMVYQKQRLENLALPERIEG